MTMEEKVQENAELGYSLQTNVKVSNTVATALINMIGIAIGKAFVMAERCETRADERHQLEMRRMRIELDDAEKRMHAKRQTDKIS